MTAEVPFAFAFQGQKMAAGSYEILRTSLPNAITVRNQKTGTVARAFTAGTDQKPGAGSGILFQKAGEKYFLVSVVDRAMASSYNLPVTRTQRESGRPVFISSR